MGQAKQGTDRMDPEARLGWGERIGYGVSGLGTTVLFFPITSFLLIYMTNVALLDIAVISAIIGVSKVLDGISDLLVGNIIDRTKSQMGKGKIWLLRMCLPFAVSTLLLFWVPPFLPTAMKYVYVFLMYNLVSTVCFTFMTVSGFSLIPLMTMNRKEQGMLSCIQAIFVSLGGLFAGSCIVPMLSRFSGSAETPQTQRGYTLTLAVLCGIMVVTSLITVFSTRERVKDGAPGVGDEKGEKLPLRRVLQALLRSKYWVLIFVIALGNNLFGQLSLSSITYFANYVLHDLEAVGWLNLTQMLPSMLVQLVVLFLMQKIDKSRLFRVGLALAAAGNLGFGLAVPSLTGMIACNIVRGMGLGIFQALILGLVADTILYTFRRTGIYAAGMGNAGIAASQKIGAGLAAALFGLMMKAAGFDALYDLQHLAQPAAVERAAVWSSAWIPGIGFCVMLLLFVCFYHLDREMAETAEDLKWTGS